MELQEALDIADDMCGGLVGMIRQNPEKYWRAFMAVTNEVYRLRPELLYVNRKEDELAP